MSTVKTAVSIDEVLFTQAEALADELGLSRSRLYGLALADYLRRHQQQQLVDRLNAVYDGEPDAEEAAWLRFAKRRQSRAGAAW